MYYIYIYLNLISFHLYLISIQGKLLLLIKEIVPINSHLHSAAEFTA